jgi:hypothetical protein
MQLVKPPIDDSTIPAKSSDRQTIGHNLSVRRSSLKPKHKERLQIVFMFKESMATNTWGPFQTFIANVNTR